MTTNPIIEENFLLHSKLAQTLYHEFAAKLPIIDYHNHLPPKEIAENRKFDNLTQIWLEGDHYKWRAMRANGVNEQYITGQSSDYEKFEKWAETVPYTLRNPLYHWTHLELFKPFGIDKLLNAQLAKEIYNYASEQLRTNLDVQTILNRFNVESLCTTDDPIDALKWHQQIKEADFGVEVKPAFRPDKSMMLSDAISFNQYVDEVSKVSKLEIHSFEDYLAALFERHNYFHENGCRLSDHGLEFPFPTEEATPSELNIIFEKLRANKAIDKIDKLKMMSAMLYEFAVWDYDKGWVQQYHVGALRDVNMKGVREVGQACGFDSIADFNYAASMGAFFNKLEEKGKLTKTIVYNLNPRDNEIMATMMGNFQDGSVAGKMQYGAAWWFLDQKDGIQKHLDTLSNQGLLSRFVGMLTDSRSFLSYSRHEYFRRILCNVLANDVNNGEIPNDLELLSQTVQDICYYNAKNYF